MNVGGASLTGHVQFSSIEPLDPALAQIAVLHRVERADPAEPLARRGGPEALAVGDGEALQLRGAAHLLETCSFRHEGGQVAFPSAETVQQPTAEGVEEVF